MVAWKEQAALLRGVQAVLLDMDGVLGATSPCGNQSLDDGRAIAARSIAWEGLRVGH